MDDVATTRYQTTITNGLRTDEVSTDNAGSHHTQPYSLVWYGNAPFALSFHFYC